MLLCEAAQHRDEFDVGISIIVLIDRKPRKLDLLITYLNIKVIAAECVFYQPSLV